MYSSSSPSDFKVTSLIEDLVSDDTTLLLYPSSGATLNLLLVQQGTAKLEEIGRTAGLDEGERTWIAAWELTIDFPTI